MFRFVMTFGESDCESIDGGWLAQPTNAMSSLAYSVIGLALVPWAAAAVGAERQVRFGIAVGLVLTGFGSWFSHGPQGWGSQFAHDISFLVLMLIIGIADIAAGVGRSPRWTWSTVGLALGVFIIVLVARPTATNILAAITLVVVIVGDHLVHRGTNRAQPWFGVAIAVLAAAAVAFLLGRSGSPLCEPSSILQAHAVWHVLGAVGIAAYAIATGHARADRSAMVPRV